MKLKINLAQSIRTNTLILLLLINNICVIAQTYYSEGKNRYTFAQTTFGYDLEYTPNMGTSFYRNSANELVESKFGSTLSPTICITGLHFWGHAEFFTGFSLNTIDLLPQTNNISYKRSGATGAKYFPWAIKINKLRPFAGLAIATFTFRQGQGTELKRVDYPILLGLTYCFKRGVLELGCNFHPITNYHYYISKNESVAVQIPQLSFSVDYKYFFDLSLNTLKRQARGELDQEYELLKSKKSLSSFSIALGPAYSFFLEKSSYNTHNRMYLDDHKISKIYPDAGIGYYNYPLDACLNISWRSYKSALNGYDVSQEVSRNSFALECFKFLGDYHGFVPFVGAILSRENFNIRETENGHETIDRNFGFFTGGIIAGWDIRSSRTDWWGVRTNIRYFPQLNLDVGNNESISMQQIELNFLQMILYPNRIASQIKNRK